MVRGRALPALPSRELVERHRGGERMRVPGAHRAEGRCEGVLLGVSALALGVLLVQRAEVVEDAKLTGPRQRARRGAALLAAERLGEGLIGSGFTQARRNDR